MLRTERISEPSFIKIVGVNGTAFCRTRMGQTVRVGVDVPKRIAMEWIRTGAAVAVDAPETASKASRKVIDAVATK